MMQARNRPASRLIEAVAFDSPTASADAAGGVVSGWTQEFTTRAHFLFLRGGETVQAARLEGRQPVVVTIRSHADADEITTAWRMRDTRRGVAYNIRSIVPTEDRRFVELTCESGVAV